MANTSGRTLRLLSLLQTHRYWPGTELADRLGVSPRTLRRDVERLRELGYPVHASRGVAGGYQLQTGAALPPLLLDDEEAVAIAVGLRTAAGGAVAGIEEASLRALTKVVQVMPPRLRRRVDALQRFMTPVMRGGPSVDPTALTVIAQGCRDDERLRFDYVRRDGAAAERLVEPKQIVARGPRWYLVAWDLGRHDWRTFRIDRLRDPRTTGERFRQRDLPGGDAEAFVEASLAEQPARYEAVVTILAPAEDVERVVQRWGEVEPLDDTSCRLRMALDSLDWVVLVLTAVAADFEVHEPPELRDLIRATARRFVRAVPD